MDQPGLVVMLNVAGLTIAGLQAQVDELHAQVDDLHGQLAAATACRPEPPAGQ